MSCVLCLAGEAPEQTYGRDIGKAQVREVQLHEHTVIEHEVTQGASELAERTEVDLAVDPDAQSPRASLGLDVDPRHLTGASSIRSVWRPVRDAGLGTDVLGCAIHGSQSRAGVPPSAMA
jgi:hypothetical protein